MTAIDRFTVWIEDVLLKAHEATYGMPLCPYARKAFADGKVRIEEFAYNPDDIDPIVDWIRWLRLTPQIDVLVLIHPEIPCDMKRHRALEDELRPLADRLEQTTFGYHPDDPTSIGGEKFKMPVCALQFQPTEMVNEARHRMLKTKYYNRFTVEELKDLNFPILGEGL